MRNWRRQTDTNPPTPAAAQASLRDLHIAGKEPPIIGPERFDGELQGTADSASMKA